MWTQEEAINFCRSLEDIAPKYGGHVALTGGLLYKDGPRKDADILVYRIRQVGRVDFPGFFCALSKMGVVLEADYGWCKKATWFGKKIDFFDPEADGHYGHYGDDIGEEVPF